MGQKTWQWFCCTTMLPLTQQNQWKATWNRLDGTSFHTHRTPHLTITSSHTRKAALQQYKGRWKIARRMICRKRWAVYLAWYSSITNINQYYLVMKVLLLDSRYKTCYNTILKRWFTSNNRRQFINPRKWQHINLS